MRGRRRALALLAALALGVPALAAIPSGDKIARAVAETNAADGRARPLLLEVDLRIAGGGPTAEGVLATHPTGLARLELRSPAGFVERHLLQGDAYRASRDGEMLARPHPFLPPVFLLQATSGVTLDAALSSFGIADAPVVLGRLGEHDCYVFGGRAIGAPPDEPPLPSLWVDIESYEPVRMVRTDGTDYRLGPIGVYDGIRLPRWIDIVSPTALRARLGIRRASEAAAPAAAFQDDWLTAPPEAHPGEPEIASPVR